MSYAQTVPTSYRPYHQLRFCGNELVGVQVPLGVDGVPALLVGASSTGPVIWISGPHQQYNAPLVPLVSAGRSQNPSVHVFRRPEGRVDVQVGDVLILSVSPRSPSRAEVEYIDFFPIGLAVRGDRNRLHVGGTVLEGNTFTNVHTAVALSSGS